MADKKKFTSDIDRLYNLVHEALDETKKAVVELQLHVATCNGLRVQAQESRKQMNQRIIEIQQTQEKQSRDSEKRLNKVQKRVSKQNKKIIKTTLMQNAKIAEVALQQERQQKKLFYVLCGILLAIIGWFFEETYFNIPSHQITEQVQSLHH